MKKLPPPLQHLARSEVSQLLLTSGRPPRVVVDDEFETVGAVLTTEAIVSLLFATGGSRYLEELGPRPTTWKLRLDGVGTVSVSAAQHGDDIEAQFTPPPDRPRVAPSEATTVPPLQRRRSSVKGAASERSSLITKPGHGAREAAGSTPPRPRGSSAALMRPPAAERESERAATNRPPRRASDPPTRKKRGLSGPVIEVQPVEEADDAEALPFEIDVSPVAPPRRSAPPPAAHPASTPPPRAASSPPPAPRSPSTSQATARLARLIAVAREEGASDLHLITGRPPLLRALGELSPRGDPLSAADLQAMVEACVPPRVAHALEDLGSCDFAMELAGYGRFRANVSRQRTGLRIGLRLIATEMPTLVSLGLPSELAAATRHHQGLVVLTGPTGHGKTCTLAALVDQLNRETTHHVITVEDPVEYVHPRRRALISQRGIGTHTRSFAAALKASLREDPDVIVVGELRDTETVRMALAASETGHLVLGTMNTESAAKAIDRLVDLFPPGDQPQVRATLAGGLKMVVSQRLLPLLDRTGMACAVELLPGSIALWNLIRDNKTFQVPSLMQRGKGIGVLRLNDALADLVRGGKVSQTAALAVSDAPEELEATLRRQRAAMDGMHGLAPPPQRPPPPPGSQPPPPPEPSRGLFQRAGALFGKKGG